MTELEKQLAYGLRKLAEQYEQDMKRLETQNLQLQQQVLGLSGKVQDLSKFLHRLNDRLTELSEG
jgi:chromosome segregation ATPase